MQVWTDFLEARGATLDSAGRAYFNDEHSPEATGLAPLSDCGMLSISGPDAVKFLQGQLTCDLRLLAEGRALDGAQCSLKGRVITRFRLAAYGEEQILICLPGDALPLLQAGLQKYSVFSKVSIEDASSQWLALGLLGAEAGAILARQAGLSIDTDGEFASGDHVLALRVDSHSYQCWIHRDRADALWQALAEDCQPTQSQ